MKVVAPLELWFYIKLISLFLSLQAATQVSTKFFAQYSTKLSQLSHSKHKKITLAALVTSEPAMMAPPMAAGLIKAAMVNGDGGENDHDGHEDDDNFIKSV